MPSLRRALRRLLPAVDQLSLGEEWTQDELEEGSCATCPECGFVAELDTLVVSCDDDVWRSP